MGEEQWGGEVEELEHRKGYLKKKRKIIKH